MFSIISPMSTTVHVGVETLHIYINSTLQSVLGVDILSPLSIFCINVLFWAKSYFGVDIDDIASISNYIKSANTNNQEQYRYRHKCNATYQVRYRCRYREFMYDFADIDIIKSLCWQCFFSSWLQGFFVRQMTFTRLCFLFSRHLTYLTVLLWHTGFTWEYFSTRTWSI